MPLATAKELDTLIVWVNAVVPDVFDGRLARCGDDEVRAEPLRMFPVGRLEHVAAVGALLAVNRPSYATGQVIGVDAAMVV
jgi:hypothetical protein